MKTKNLILGAAAATLAVGSAVASSMFAPVTAWVNVRTQANPVFHCEQTSFSCESTGTAQCKINVEVGPEPGTPTLANARNASCATIVNTNASAIGLYDPATVILEVQ